MTTTKNFKRAEFACKCGHTDCPKYPPVGSHAAWMLGGLMLWLQDLRDFVSKKFEFDIPVVVTSGWRCHLHPAEKSKLNPGSHAQGKAADIKFICPAEIMPLVRFAAWLFWRDNIGEWGVGWYKTWLHLDLGHDTWPRPALWHQNKDSTSFAAAEKQFEEWDNEHIV